jgi:hypothetical protein
MPGTESYCAKCNRVRLEVEMAVRREGEEEILGTPEFEQRWRKIRGKELDEERGGSDNEDEDDDDDDDVDDEEEEEEKNDTK